MKKFIFILIVICVLYVLSRPVVIKFLSDLIVKLIIGGIKALIGFLTSSIVK